jgi:hypothetical protein
VSKILVILGIMILSLTALASQTLPPVSQISIDETTGCGTVPVPKFKAPPCPTLVTLTFTASTTGICDTFSASFEEKNGVAFLTILKTTEDQCTRPQHAPMDVEQRLYLSELPAGPIVLANPELLFVKRHFRP